VIGGLILSGGASSRMGSPKALLTWQGETFLARLLRLLSELCSPVFIVTGAHDREIRSALPHLSPQLHYNPGHASGQFSSLRFGLSLFPPDTSVIYWPVDFPAVSPETLRELAAHSHADLAKPTYQGQSGHPILLGPAARLALAAASPAANARDVLKTLPAEKFAVQDPACVADVDTMEDYRRLLASGAQSA
jgi:molybdenum cofactor cytidylyltransferase